MKVTRRHLLEASVLLGSMALMGCKDKTAVQVKTGANGLYVQPWFEDSFLDLKEELIAAQGEGKLLTLLFEQAGCPYCLDMHQENFNHPAIKTFMMKHFRVIQIDMKGSREVTDFTGKVLTEAAFAKEWGVHFTPTLSFLPPDINKVVGQHIDNAGRRLGREVEAFRLTGFWRAFHFESVLHFVHSGSYKNENLQNFMSERKKQL